MTVYQAIQTKFLCPTNFKGPRYKATCAAGSIIVSANDALDPEENHVAACRALRAKIIARNTKLYSHGYDPVTDPWNAPVVCGQLPDGSYAHVFKGR